MRIIRLTTGNLSPIVLGTVQTNNTDSPCPRELTSWDWANL